MQKRKVAIVFSLILFCKAVAAQEIKDSFTLRLEQLPGFNYWYTGAEDTAVVYRIRLTLCAKDDSIEPIIYRSCSWQHLALAPRYSLELGAMSCDKNIWATAELNLQNELVMEGIIILPIQTKRLKLSYAAVFQNEFNPLDSLEYSLEQTFQIAQSYLDENERLVESNFIELEQLPRPISDFGWARVYNR